MNSQAGDEFAHIFDKLTLADFTPLRTLTFPSEDQHFDEFVTTRVESTRLALTPGKDMLHAALTNGIEVRQLAPRPREQIKGFIKRATLNARDMMAHTLYFCSVTNCPPPVGGQCVIWVAGHIDDGDQTMRMGLIEIQGDRLGQCTEVENPEVVGQASLLLQGVLMP